MSVLPFVTLTFTPTQHTRSRPFLDTVYRAGALKATNNRGLQPAMDHLIENEGNPVPDLSSVSSTATSTRPPGGGDPMDEDEDLEALRAVYGKTGGADSAVDEAEAKVRRSSYARLRSLFELKFCIPLEHQVYRVWEGI